jgi:transposase-like protein
MPAPYPLEFRREAVALLRSSGKSAPQLAAELGVSPQSLRNWARQIDVEEGKAEGLSSDEREELRRLRRELRIVTEEREILKKSRGLLRQGKRDPVSVFGFIAATKAEHSIKLMCRVLEVSRSGFPAWAAREPSPRAVADAALTGRIAEIHKDSLKTYGSPRVHAELRLEAGVRVGRKRVERLMRAAGLRGRSAAGAARPRSACRASGRRPTSSSVTSTRPSRTDCGQRISRTSAPGRAGCIWRR